jgi:hypothetical protein
MSIRSSAHNAISRLIDGARVGIGYFSRFSRIRAALPLSLRK